MVNEPANTYQHLLWMLENYAEEFEQVVSDGLWDVRGIAFMEELHKFKQVAALLVERHDGSKDLNAFLDKLDETEITVLNRLKWRAWT